MSVMIEEEPGEGLTPDEEAMRRELGARTRAGLERARALGQKLGQPPKLTPTKDSEIRAARDAGVPVRELARRYKVGEDTIRRSLARTKPAIPPDQSPKSP